MYPILFTLFGRSVAAYGLMMILGGLAAVTLGVFVKKFFGDERHKDFFYAALFAVAFGIIGAFIFKPIVNTFAVIFNPEKYNPLPFGQVMSFIFGEIVFYGGMMGGAFGIFLYCRIFKLKVIPMFDLAACALGVGHALGRIGCFFGGCCYGAEVSEHNPLGVIYPAEPGGFVRDFGAPAGVPLLNVPIMEAIFLVILTIVNILLFWKVKKTGLTSSVYLVGYGIWRFVIEYFRGDVVRGKYGIFTTSQYIALICVICGAVLLYFSLFYKKKGRAAE